MDKIKAFFSNFWTQLVAWVLLVLCIVVLIIAGVTVEEINSGVVLTAAIVSAVAALVAFIASKLKK